MNILKNSYSVVLMIAFVGVFSPICAQSEEITGMGQGMGMGRNMPTFSEYDLDGDGKIIETEFNEARSKRRSERAQQGYQMRNIGNAPSFTDIDTDEDGGINPEEFAAHQSQRRQQRAQ
jgi:hypothetical protein